MTVGEARRSTHLIGVLSCAPTWFWTPFACFWPVLPMYTVIISIKTFPTTMAWFKTSNCCPPPWPWTPPGHTNCFNIASSSYPTICSLLRTATQGSSMIHNRQIFPSDLPENTITFFAPRLSNCYLSECHSWGSHPFYCFGTRKGTVLDNFSESTLYRPNYIYFCCTCLILNFDQEE